jgi:TIR domain
VSFDVFVSYATKDKTVADAVCARLESVGIRCWIAPRDIVASTSYGEAIIDAIHSAKLMVLVFSANANASGHIPKEVERAVSNGVPILPFRIEDVAPGKSLDYFIGSVHWLDAMTPPMEKHLDQLAATVTKLLPAVAGEPRPSAAPGSGTWQQRGQSTAPPTAATPFTSAPPTLPSSAATEATSAVSTRASSKKKLWIAVGGVVAFLVLLTILFGRSGSSDGGGQTPSATNPPADAGGSTDTNPGSVAAKPDSRPAPSNPAARTTGSRDPFVGCYQWFNNAPVVVHTDGSIYGGPFKGRWQMLNTAQRTYRLLWPADVGNYTVSPDQRSMSGESMYGVNLLAGRTAGSSGITGTWRWPNGALVTVFTNGTFMCGPFNGTWKTIDASRGTYTMTWPGPIDTIAIDPSGTHVTGANQYGVAISGVRTEPCKTN